ncbi:TetR/AcrR family transcriptional regulator [Candidatus Harpocratesius sp.]
MELFKRLPLEKQKRICLAGIKEIVLHGIESASTNRIVKNAKISKGSLFKYFQNKEKFIQYLIEYSSNLLLSEIAKYNFSSKQDLLERIVLLAEFEFLFYAKYPNLYHFFQLIIQNPVYLKYIQDEYTKQAVNILNNCLAESTLNGRVIPSYLLSSIQELLYYTLAGINQKWFILPNQYNGTLNQKNIDKKTALNNLKEQYMEDLISKLNIMFEGINNIVKNMKSLN